MSESPINASLPSGNNPQPLVVNIVERGADTASRTFEIEAPRCVIGSGADADLQLRTSDVSNSQCEIVRNPAGVYVRELSEGMSVNGLDVDEAWVYQGDTMTFGNVEMKIEAIGKLLLQAEGHVSAEAHERNAEQGVASASTCLTCDSCDCEPESCAANDTLAQTSSVETAPTLNESPQANPEPAVSEESFHTDFVIPAIDNPEDDFHQYSSCETVHDIQSLLQSSRIGGEVAPEPNALGANAGSTVEPVEATKPPVFENPIVEQAPVAQFTPPSIDMPAKHDSPKVEEAPVAEVAPPVAEVEEQVARPSENADYPAAVHDPFEAFESPNMTDPIDVALSRSTSIDGSNQIADALARLGKVDVEVSAQEAVNSVEAQDNQVSSDAAKAENQANWLDELYDSVIPEGDKSDQADASEQLALEDQGWKADPVTSQLLQPNADPSQFTSLPEPTAEEAREVINKVEEEMAQQRAERVEKLRNEMAPQELAPQPVQPQDYAEPLKALIRIEEEATPDVETSYQTDQSVEEEQAEASSFVVDPLQEQPAETQVEVTPETPANESVADVLARMAAAGQIPAAITGLGEEQSDGFNASDATVQPQTPVAEPGPVAEAAGAPQAGDDSVQDYMNQLMNRLRGDEEMPAGEGLVAEVPVATKAEERSEDLTPANPLTASEFVPNNVAREKSSTLDALRQIANQSVESAITASNREKNAQTSLIYLGGTGACLFLSAVLFMMSRGVLDIAFIMAVLFAIGCVGMGFMFVNINASNDHGKSVAKARREVREDNASEAETQAK